MGDSAVDIAGDPACGSAGDPVCGSAGDPVCGSAGELACGAIVCNIEVDVCARVVATSADCDTAALSLICATTSFVTTVFDASLSPVAEVTSAAGGVAAAVATAPLAASDSVVTGTEP